MIDRFDRKRFEDALPRHKDTQQPVWRGLGLIGGEYCYTVEIQPGVLIYIRSSVKADGWAADTAEDSIRCWLTDPQGRPLASKDQAYVTRVNGWAGRLTDLLRKMWRLGSQLGECPHCGATTLAVKTKTGQHVGRYHERCGPCGLWLRWLED